MSLFDDDFYSTKPSREYRRASQTGSGFGMSRGGLRGFLSATNLRIAIVSSLVSALLVSLLFILFFDHDDPANEARPALTGGQMLVETSERIISASAKVRPVVVSIINITQQSIESQSGRSARGRLVDPDEVPDHANLGSGVIIEKKDGKAYIVTNAHVVANAARLQVVLIDGSKKEATLVGEDKLSDLALLTVDAEGIDRVAEIGDSEKLRVGEMVIAVGNPLGFGDSVTNGIVSFLHRIVPVSLNQDGIHDWEQEVIQTTAAINEGNSGGVLADLNGKVVGINSMKIADTGVEGIGFAIPIRDVMPVVKELQQHGKVLRPYMGIYSMDLSVYFEQQSEHDPAEDEEFMELIIPEEVTGGVLVLEAVGPAGEAGLKLNDIITELDGTPVKSMLELRKYLYGKKKIGDTVTVTYYRGGKQEKLKVVLGEKSGS